MHKMTDEIIKQTDTETQDGLGKCRKQRPDCLYHEKEGKKKKNSTVRLIWRVWEIPRNAANWSSARY